MSALMHRLDIVQQSIDSDNQNQVSIAINHMTSEENRLVVDLKASRSKIASGVQTLKEVLRTIDSASAAERSYKVGRGLMEHDGFVPWTGGGIDRLLLKLDIGNVQSLV